MVEGVHMQAGIKCGQRLSRLSDARILVWVRYSPSNFAQLCPAILFSTPTTLDRTTVSKIWSKRLYLAYLQYRLVFD